MKEAKVTNGPTTHIKGFEEMKIETPCAEVRFFTNPRNIDIADDNDVVLSLRLKIVQNEVNGDLSVLHLQKKHNNDDEDEFRNHEDAGSPDSGFESIRFCKIVIVPFLKSFFLTL